MISCYIYKCFEKIVVMLDEKDVDHHIKVEICKFLSIIGQKLIEHKKSFIGLNTDYVIKRISLLTSDRIVKVQMSARESLRIWKKLEKQYEEIERMKMKVKFDVKDGDRLIEMKLKEDRDRDVDSSVGGNPNGKGRDFSERTGRVGEKYGGERRNLNADDSLEMKTYSSKQNSIARGADVFRSNNIVEKTHLKQRAHNYQKKRSGTGGGFIAEFDRKEKDRKKSSFNEMREKFKQQIMQDKMSFTRKNNRSKYQNYVEDEEDELNDSRNEMMEEIQEDPNDIKESEVIQNVKRFSQANPKPVVRNNQANVKSSDEESPDINKKIPNRNELTFAREEVQATQAAVPTKPQNKQNPYSRQSIKATNNNESANKIPPQHHQDIEESQNKERTMRHESGDEEDEDNDEGEEYRYENETIRGDSTVVNKPSVASMASTVYFGQLNNGSQTEHRSIADTVYFQGGNSRMNGSNHFIEDKSTQLFDARTVLCDSVESGGEKSEDSFVGERVEWVSFRMEMV